MPRQNPIKVKLFVVLGDGHLGPIDLTIWEDHTPEKMIHLAMDVPLAIPLHMQTRGPRFLYSVRNSAKLNPRSTYRDQGVSQGDILVLTDQSDEQVVLALAQVLADQAGVQVAELVVQETRSKAVLRGALEGIPYAGKALAALICGPKRGG